MNWYESPWRFLAISVISAVSSILVIFLCTTDMRRLYFPIITFSICLPMIMMSMYMWITGQDKKYLVGMDWSDYTEKECPEVVSYIGYWHMVPMMVLLNGMCILFVNFILGAMMVFFPLMVMFSAEMKPAYKKIVSPLPSTNSGFAAFNVMLVILICVVPAVIFSIIGIHNLENGTSVLFFH